MSLTVHCVVKNEENFIGYALRSVIDYADHIYVFDTGSTDHTKQKIEEVARQYPGKILFEVKGDADPVRHTALRQEMIERTTTDWFMILDGDEVWTTKAMRQAMHYLKEQPTTACLIAPFYLCVGDVYHYSWRGTYLIRGQKMHATPRFFRRTPGIRWEGEYNHDAVVNAQGQRVFEGDQVVFLSSRFWHVSHLRRSTEDDDVYSSGLNRAAKRRLTYFLIGKRIYAPVPEVFVQYPSASTAALPLTTAFSNCMQLLFNFLFHNQV